MEDAILHLILKQIWKLLFEKAHVISHDKKQRYYLEEYKDDESALCLFSFFFEYRVDAQEKTASIFIHLAT